MHSLASICLQNNLAAMVLGTELQEHFSDVSQTLCPEQIARAHNKSSELGNSLGIFPQPHNDTENLTDADESLSPDLFSKAHHESSELAKFLGLSQQPDDGNEKLTDRNDTSLQMYLKQLLRTIFWGEKKKWTRS